MAKQEISQNQLVVEVEPDSLKVGEGNEMTSIWIML